MPCNTYTRQLEQHELITQIKKCIQKTHTRSRKSAQTERYSRVAWQLFCYLGSCTVWCFYNDNAQ